MGTYLQWRTAADRGEVRRLTWVCGDQLVLVDEVLATITDLLQVPTWEHVVLRARDVPAATVWAAAHQYPLTPGANRLLVVRDAQLITRWEPLAGWLDATRALPGVHLVLVSDEADTPHQPGAGRRPGPPAPHIALLQARRRLAQVVRCAAPGETIAVDWVRRHSHLDADTAQYLVHRCAGNLDVIAAACAKITLFDTQPGRTVIDHICPPPPTAVFTDALIAGDKPGALRALARMGDRDRLGAIALLGQRLDILAALWRATRAGQGEREITGVATFLTRQYLPHARNFDPKRCAYIRQALAVVDDAYRSGARIGVMELLVTLV